MPDFKQDISKLLKRLVKDTRVDVTEAFDRNFERKAFFDQSWKPSKQNATAGSLLVRSGALRRSISREATEDNTRIIFTSSQVYAAIHNEGGTITITTKMKRFFWAKYIEASGGLKYAKNGNLSQSKRNLNLNATAMFFKAMALKKVGSKIEIPKRQFIGHHSEIDKIVEQNCSEFMQNIQDMISQQIKNDY